MNLIKIAKFCGFIATYCMFCIPVFALDEVEGTQANRYTLERVDDNFVRLDKQTGQMSICKFSNENLICRIAADDRDALINEISNLQNRIDNLDKKLKATFDDGTNLRERQNAIPKNQEELSQNEKILEKNFESALKYSNKIMRRFFDVMKELRLDFKDEKFEREK